MSDEELRVVEALKDFDKNGRKYILVKRVSKYVNVCKPINAEWLECFSDYDLGIVEHRKWARALHYGERLS